MGQGKYYYEFNIKKEGDEKQQVWTAFRSESIRQSFEDDTQREHYKEEQKKDLKSIADAKLDLLSRTVVVGSVLPLRVEKNKSALRRFFEINYGPVQKVVIDKKSRGKFPRGRVTFNFKRDAEKIFGGISLVDAASEGRQEKIICPSAGYKGVINVRPSSEHKGMLEEDLNTSTIIRVNTKNLSLGHWFPSGKDACMNLPGLEDVGREQQQSIWVEENPTADVNPIVIINTEKALIELDITHCELSEMENLLSLFGGIMTQKRYILSFRFKDLAHPMELCRSGGKLSITFALKHPPRLSSIITNLQTDWEDRIRLTEMSGIVGLGSCLGYTLGVSEVEINRMVIAKAFHKLKKMGVFSCQDELDLLHQADIRKEKINENHKQKLEKKIESAPSHRLGLHLRSILDAQSCIWYDMLNDEVSGQDIFELIQDGDEDLAESTLIEMRDMHGRSRYPAKMFHALYRADTEVDEAPRQVPEFCVSLPRILLTPCQVKVLGFEVEMSNRIVRKFIGESGFSNESFIRLSIGDENTDKLYSDDFSQQVEERITSIILNGINLGKKRYRFLAYSSSQLKEQSLWMVCPEHGWSVKEMRNSMGNFSMCKTPSKYAARIGQCFSTTIDTSYSGIENRYEGIANWTKEEIGLSSSTHKIRVKDNLKDIVSDNSDKEMVHSDGVGLVTKDLLQDILKQLPFGRPRDKKDVSAIQIRYGGAKGVLVAWDSNLLSGYDVCLRPSQVKFKAPYDNLEVITVTKQIPYFLNRSVILLGQHKGIRADIFIELQDVHIKGLNRMLEDASFAARFLPQLSGPDNGLITSLRHMLHSGLAPATDPFLYSCLHCIRSHHLMNLRKKARVHVEDGAVLIGGIDELRLIPENCVFLQVQSSVDDKYRVITGQVMVTKHPVVHPGDMRMLKAVDIPELRRHKNILLFSQSMAIDRKQIR